MIPFAKACVIFFGGPPFVSSSFLALLVLAGSLQGDVEVEGGGGAGSVWVGADASALDGLA